MYLVKISFCSKFLFQFFSQFQILISQSKELIPSIKIFRIRLARNRPEFMLNRSLARTFDSDRYFC